MKQFYAALAAAAFCLVQASSAQASASTVWPRNTTVTGTVVRLYGSTLVLQASSAASYLVETGRSALQRKNGAVMGLAEILAGDKLEVKGSLWADNSINAAAVRNLSLYAHQTTFSGKITSINPRAASFVMESRSHGTQTVLTDSLTTFKKNSQSAAFGDLTLDMTATVKAGWDRSYSQVIAKSVAATLRLINITLTGRVAAKTDTGLTVLANGNVMYGVSLTGAKLTDKNGKAMVLQSIVLGDTVKVTGKHASSGLQVQAAAVKDSTR
ncbi:MAG TPA: DUF5666 domain-containing protein [Patescibacteria group bacterium]|nr:DUF5666 domain-containing protein [Patescibacteria group bacterium]